MLASLLSPGLVLPRTGLQLTQAQADTHITVKAAVVPDYREELRVDLLVEEGAQVAQGQPLLRLRTAPDIALVAPMAGRVARIALHPGHKLSQIVLFHDADGDRYKFETSGTTSGASGLRSLIQASGLWRAFRSRPFRRMPRAGATPPAIFCDGRRQQTRRRCTHDGACLARGRLQPRS